MNTQIRFLILMLFVLAVLLTSFSLVYSKHQTRQLFVEMQQLKTKINSLDADWGRLQLEQSAWSGHGRIERIAHEKLSMVFPKSNNVIFIKP